MKLDQLKYIIKDADYKEILTKGFTHLLVQLGGTFMGFLFTVFITDEFGAESYGMVVWSFSVFLMLSVFGRLGLDINVLKFFAIETNQTDAGIFYRSIIKSFLFSSLISLLAYWQSDYLITQLFPDPKPQLIPYLNWSLLAVPFWSVAIISASFLRAKKQNFSFAFFNNPGRFLFSLIFIYILFNFSKDPIIAVRAHFYAIVIVSLISFALVVKQLMHIRLKTKTNSWRFVQQAFPMMLSSSVIVFLGWTDTFVMGIYETDDQVGIYGVCVKIAALTTFVMYALSSILAPKIAVAYADKTMPLFNRMVRFSTLINFSSTLVVVGIILGFHQFFLGIFGAEFKQGFWVLLLLCIGQLVAAFFGSVGVVMQMIGKQRVYQNMVLIALVVNLSLNFILTPLYGGEGAAMATIVSVLFSTGLPSYYMRKNMAIHTYFRPKMVFDVLKIYSK